MLISPRLSIRQNPQGSKKYVVVLHEMLPEHCGNPGENVHEESVVAPSPHEAALIAHAQIGLNDWGWANHVKVYERAPHSYEYAGMFDASKIHDQALRRDAAKMGPGVSYVKVQSGFGTVPYLQVRSSSGSTVRRIPVKASRR